MPNQVDGVLLHTMSGSELSRVRTPSPIDFAFRTMQHPPAKRNKGGEVRIVDSNSFKVATQIAAALVTVHPGGLRELHWHPNADEWQFFISSKARQTVFATEGRARTMDFETGSSLEI
jgi:oxalate decarboxylase